MCSSSAFSHPCPTQTGVQSVQCHLLQAGRATCALGRVFRLRVASCPIHLLGHAALRLEFACPASLPTSDSPVSLLLMLHVPPPPQALAPIVPHGSLQ